MVFNKHAPYCHGSIQKRPLISCAVLLINVHVNCSSKGYNLGALKQTPLRLPDTFRGVSRLSDVARPV